MTAPAHLSPLHTLERGAGEPVVLLHSGGMSSRQWRKLMERLASTHRVVAPDFLGSGDNPPWPDDEPFDFSYDVEAVARVVRALGAPAHLVGHSYGGLVALTLARTQPTLVRSVTAYDPVAFSVIYDADDGEGRSDLERAYDDPRLRDEASGGTEPWVEAFVDYWNGAGTYRSLPAPSREAFLRGGRKAYYEVRSLMRDRTPRDAYATLIAPALLMDGAHSPAAARRVVALLAEAIPDAERITVEGAGHMGPITHADAVNEWIVQHVTAHT